MQGPRHHAIVWLATLAMTLALACTAATPVLTPPTGTTSAPGQAVEGVLVVAVGDIACDPSDRAFAGGEGTQYKCRQKATSDLALSLEPDAVLVLGDTQYPDAALPGYAASYHPSWGRLKALTHPAPGNHEYGTSGASGYFTYFGAAAGDQDEGWYSFDLGTWHVVALNSMCGKVGGCDADDPQATWLRADLAEHGAARCTLAYWHHPRFSSGPHGNNTQTDPLWRALSASGAEIVLSGHDHDYERFGPQTPSGARDDGRGMRQFVVGTGGESVYPVTRVEANSEFHKSGQYGVLALSLEQTSYSWRFITDGGETLDRGSGTCH